MSIALKKMVVIICPSSGFSLKLKMLLSLIFSQIYSLPSSRGLGFTLFAQLANANEI